METNAEALTASQAGGVTASVGNLVRHLRDDTRGAVLIEAAIALPVLLVLLLGIVTYAGWFMAAHSLQQAANDAARAAMAGIDAEERQQLVDESLASSVLHTGTLNPELVEASNSLDGSYFTVSLTYDVRGSGLFSTNLIPLPGDTIQRNAVVQLTSP